MMINGGLSYSSAYMTVSLAALAVAVLVSIASYHLFERKMLALKDVITEEGFFARAWRKLLLLFNPSSTR
jgi:peptidoglycan/LPS O-acetylase OafA/YrhL